jgi:hypothetical protein
MTIFSDLASEWREGEQHVSDWFARHAHNQASAAPAAASPTQPKENHMSVLDDLKGLVADVEAIGEDGLASYKAIKANPETAGLLDELAALATTAGIPQGYITGTGQALKVLRAAYTAAAAQPDGSGQQQAPAQQ